MLSQGSDADGPYVLIAVKAVPGAKRDEVAGVLGEGESARLKVRVSAPPEGGKANKAICRVIAGAVGVKPGAVEVFRGHGNPEKTVRIHGAELDEVRRRLTGGG